MGNPPCIKITRSFMATTHLVMKQTTKFIIALVLAVLCAAACSAQNSTPERVTYTVDTAGVHVYEVPPAYFASTVQACRSASAANDRTYLVATYTKERGHMAVRVQDMAMCRVLSPREARAAK